MAVKKSLITRSADLSVFFLLAAMVLWFTWEMVWGGKVPFFRDLGPYFYPMRYSLAQSFRAGELPLWNRYMAMGFPLLADFQSGTFYPPHLLYLALPFWTAVRAIFVLHFFIAATGGYMLCRRWNYPPYLAILGATLFTLGGTIVSLSNLLNHFQTAVWLPWIIYFWERVLRSKDSGGFLSLVLILLFQFLAGSPELYALSVVVLVLDGLRNKAGDRAVTYRRIFFSLIAANALVAALAMVQILPTVELLISSRFNYPIVFSEAISLSLHPANLLDLFVPNKEVDTNVYMGIRLFFGRDLPFIVSYYMGAISLVGTIFWLFYAPRKEKAVLLGVVIVTVILAMGRYTPFYSILYGYIPVFKLVRFPEKFFFLVHAFLLFIALRGLCEFNHRDRPTNTGPFLLLSFITALLSVLYLFFRFDSDSLLRLIAWSKQVSVSTETIKSYTGVLLSLERQIALISAFSILFFLWDRKKIGNRLFRYLLVGMVFVDLSSAHRSFLFLLDPDRVTQGPRIIQDLDPEPTRLFSYSSRINLHPSYYLIYSQMPFHDFNSLLFSNFYPNTGVFYGIEYMQEIDALGRGPYLEFLMYANEIPPERQYMLLGAMNVKYISSLNPLPEEGISVLNHFPQYHTWLYTLDDWVPRSYIVPKAIVEKIPSKTLDRLSEEEFNPLKEVVLDHPLELPSPRALHSRAEIVRYTNKSVTIKAALDGSGILVLTDSFSPGWKVFVNGEEKKVLRVNLFFRGVALGQGRHLVEFRYEPLSFTIGLAVSLTTICGIAIWLIYVLAIRKKKAVPTV